MAAKLLLVAGLLASTLGESLTANPIRKVVTMLQQMQKKVEKEGEAEKVLFDKYMCYCKNSGGDLAASIAAAETKSPALASKIEESEAKAVQLKDDVKQAQTDRAGAKKSMAAATALRSKTGVKFGQDSGDLKTNVAALKKAIAALEKGAAGAFLQSAAAVAVKSMIATQSMAESDRQEVAAFLSGQSDYAPASGEITGILKQMFDSMVKDLAAMVSEEKSSIGSHNALMSAGNKEVAALGAAIESKTVRSGELAVAIVQMKNDLGDTATALEEDKKFLADMEKNCGTKQAEWDAIEKNRSLELVALADTIKVLNDDDALELFKKTLPGASFMQLTSSMAAMKQRALKFLRDAHSNKLDFIFLALHGQKVGFDKIVKMIDDMVVLLKKEQVDDDSKKEYCDKQFDSLDDSKKELERSIAEAAKGIEATQDALDTLGSEIKATKDSIKDLDKRVAEATENRKEEHDDFNELQATDATAKEVLGFAKNRLNKFYNPKLYVPPPKRELSQEDAIVTSMGGTLAPTAAPGGIAGTGISLVQIADDEAPPPAPEAPGAFKKKTGESNGVIAMIDLLIKDLDKELTESSVTEKHAQAEYEEVMEDAKKKRSTDSRTLMNKVSDKADAGATLQGHKEDHASALAEHGATEKVIFSLHGECDWLLQYFDVRQNARSGEIDALGKAKAVLSGADFSFVQMKRSLRGQ